MRPIPLAAWLGVALGPKETMVNDEARKRSAQRSRIIAEVYAAWSKEQAGHFVPDPAYADDPNYSEHADLISTPHEAQAELHRRTLAALEAAGLGRTPSDHRLARRRSVGDEEATDAK